MNTLNEDYRATNGNIGSVRQQFQNDIADVEIEFCLDRILRVQTSNTCFNPNTQSNAMKSAATGGSTIVNPDDYLNIWIVDLCGNSGGGVAGYALLPTPGVHGSSVDGLVIDYQLGFDNGNGGTATHGGSGGGGN